MALGDSIAAVDAGETAARSGDGAALEDDWTSGSGEVDYVDGGDKSPLQGRGEDTAFYRHRIVLLPPRDDGRARERGNGHQRHLQQFDVEEVGPW